MIVHELRIRYAVNIAFGHEIIHGIICHDWDMRRHVDKINEYGYRLVGIDERHRDEDERIPVGYGWIPTNSKFDS